MVPLLLLLGSGGPRLPQRQSLTRSARLEPGDLEVDASLKRNVEAPTGRGNSLSGTQTDRLRGLGKPLQTMLSLLVGCLDGQDNLYAVRRHRWSLGVISTLDPL